MKERHEDILDLVNLEIGFRSRGKSRHTVSGPLNTSLAHGELVALMGVNGSGKSTLLRTLSGLQNPLGGDVLIHGGKLQDHSARELAKKLSYVSTEVVRVQGMQVKQLVAMGRYPHTNWFGSMTDEDHEKVRHAMGLTSLQSMADKDMDELSDGERQRAMIARTLAQDTPVLMLDEPTAFLDLSHKFEVIRLLRILSHEHGRSILFSTHDIQVALREADKVWLLSGNEILEGAPEDLVLSGALNDAMLDGDSPADVGLDMESGEFRLNKVMQIQAHVIATDKILKMWTIRALERMGINAQSNQSGEINVLAEKKDGRGKWTVEKNGLKIELNNIYELSLYLRTKINQNSQP